AVVDDALVSAAEQTADHVRTHSSQADHSELHGRSPFRRSNCGQEKRAALHDCRRAAPKCQAPLLVARRSRPGLRSYVTTSAGVSMLSTRGWPRSSISTRADSTADVSPSTSRARAA